MFDPRTCGIEVGAVDLDGGPGDEDLQLARVWTGSSWAWTADWRVADTRLERPGAVPTPLDDTLLTVEHVDGRVTRWAEEGVWTDVLRDEDGAFLGVRRHGRSLRSGGLVAEADDGRHATRVLDADGRLAEVTDEWGRRTRYGWEGASLSSITWADGVRIRLAPGQIDGPAGRWTCEADATRTRFVAPGGGVWLLERSDEGARLVDPAGAVVHTRYAEGRLVGWDDPGGGRTRRVVDGDVTTVTDATGAVWRASGRPWTGITLPDGALWRMGRDDLGRLTSLTDPMGRRAQFERNTEGRIVGQTWGGATVRFDRDRDGRIIGVQPGAGGQIRIGRDGTGRVVRVADGAGAAWSLPRDDAGRVRAITDPGGVAWELGRDALGRVVSVKEPSGRVVSVSRREDDRVGSFRLGLSDRWELARGPSGALTGLRDPEGRLTGWSRDDAGRARSVHRPDRSVVPLSRDAAGEIVGAGELRVLRDAAGRPLGLTLGDEGLVWARDGAGAVVGVEGPGVHLGLSRDATGRIREIVTEGQPTVSLQRDAGARVSAAAGGMGVSFDRDPSGRIVGLRRAGGDALSLDRDMRGQVSAVRIGERRWRIGRDAGGRIVDAEGPGGVRLGVDRDAAGEPRLMRTADGSLAEISRSDEAVDVVVRDAASGVEGSAGWSWDAGGRLATLRSAVAWTLRRDPLGILVAMESAGRVWARLADHAEGPDGAWVGYDLDGHPRAGRTPEGVVIWGVAEGEVGWVTGEEGELRELAGRLGSVQLTHDGLGRLLGWSGRGGTQLRWDALGRLASVDGVATEGWSGLFSWGSQVRMPVADAGVARPGGAVVFGPDGGPITTIHGGGLELSPGGLVLGPAAGEVATGGRFAPLPGGPLIGGTDAIEPLSGRPTAGALRLPWAPPVWEAGGALSPWADPDGTSAVWWDPGGWAPRGPWHDPMALLAAAARAPGGRTMAEPAGVGWLPASLAATWPQVLPDPRAWPFEDEPEVLWVMEAIRTAVPPRSESLVEVLLAHEVNHEAETVPGLFPSFPVGFR